MKGIFNTIKITLRFGRKKTIGYEEIQAKDRNQLLYKKMYKNFG